MKTCFVISSIGSKDSPERKDADLKYDQVFQPVLDSKKYQITRSDKITTSGYVSREIIRKLIDSDLVISDISDRNPNVFYELAIRNAINKPYIIIKKETQSIPFDIKDPRALSIDLPLTEQRKKDVQNQLKNYIEYAEEHPEISSESIFTGFGLNQFLITKDGLVAARLHNIFQRVIPRIIKIIENLKQFDNKPFDKFELSNEFIFSINVVRDIIENQINEIIKVPELAILEKIQILKYIKYLATTNFEELENPIQHYEKLLRIIITERNVLGEQYTLETRQKDRYAIFDNIEDFQRWHAKINAVLGYPSYGYKAKDGKAAPESTWTEQATSAKKHPNQDDDRCYTVIPEFISERGLNIVTKDELKKEGFFQ